MIAAEAEALAAVNANLGAADQITAGGFRQALSAYAHTWQGLGLPVLSAQWLVTPRIEDPGRFGLSYGGGGMGSCGGRDPLVRGCGVGAAVPGARTPPRAAH